MMVDSVEQGTSGADKEPTSTPKEGSNDSEETETHQKVELGSSEKHPLDPGEHTESVTYTYEDENGTTQNDTETYNSTKIEQELVELINEYREAEGEPRQDVNPMLMSSARAKAYDMVNREYYGHEGPNGEGPDEFFQRSGAECHGSFQENLNTEMVGLKGMDNESVAQMLLESWQNSPSHNRAMLSTNNDNPGEGELGVGVYLKYNDNGDIPGIEVYAVMHKCV